MFSRIKFIDQLLEERERRHFERAIRKNGNVSMLASSFHGPVCNPPLETIGESLREVYNGISPAEVPRTFVALLNEFDMVAA